jgi:uncharacterized protein (DUF736 family)
MDGVKLGGLWKHTAKDGKPYLSGSLGTARLLIFPNSRKEKAQHPDYEMFLVEARPKEQAEAASSADRTTAEGPGADDGDLPF